ncbi:MAG: transglycosylase domain-containing protein, partial [Anaerolineales bacterium]
SGDENLHRELEDVEADTQEIDVAAVPSKAHPENGDNHQDPELEASKSDGDKTNDQVEGDFNEGETLSGQADVDLPNTPVEPPDDSVDTIESWWAGAPFEPIESLLDEDEQDSGITASSVDKESAIVRSAEKEDEEQDLLKEGTTQSDIEPKSPREERTQAADVNEQVKPEVEPVKSNANTQVIPQNDALTPEDPQSESSETAHETLKKDTQSSSKKSEKLDLEDTHEVPLKSNLHRASDDIPTVPPPHVPPDWTPQNPNLPKNVSQIDPQATRVTTSAYQPTPRQEKQDQRYKTQPTRPGQKRGRRPSEMERPKKPKKKKNVGGCFLKILLVLGFLIILALLVLGSIGIYQYFRISASLPNVNELQNKAAQFETTRILDRNGNLLYEILDPNAGRRTYVPLEEISPYLIAATIATEDKDFYTNPGFDLFGVARALWQNYTKGGIYSGASTITQQLARALLLDPSERYEQSYQRKAREIVLAYKITQEYSKEEILELYLNENFYGNMAYGVQAAAETYFNSTAEMLDLAQASFLAGLPQAPSVYDIYNNRESTLYRQRSVLVLMYELSQERDCIEVGTNRQPVCVSYAEATQAGIDLANYEFPVLTFNMQFPHWVVYVKTLLEEQFDPQTIYRSGFTVYTTLDPELQREAERIVADQVDLLKAQNATNGALLAMDPNTGEILTMVGSADFYSEAI